MVETKLDCAIKASKKLIANLHRDGLDRGCIATFNDYLTVRQEFTFHERSLHRSLDGLKDAAKGETRLYDSIYDVAVGTFRRKASPTRPWVLIVVTDGDDNCSSMGARRCGENVLNGFASESDNYVFVVGVGDRVNTKKMEEMADAGGFDYIPAKNFPLLEIIFLSLAHKVTTSLSLSVGNVSIGNVSASWAEIQRERQLSSVAIDYALLIDVSASMGDRAVRQAPARAVYQAPAQPVYQAPRRALQTAPEVDPTMELILAMAAMMPPSPQCFAGHALNEAHHVGRWSCDVCGAQGQTQISDYHCAYCNFDACPKHCESGRPCEPLSYCQRGHPLRFTNIPGTPRPWTCDEDYQCYIGDRLRCNLCDYDMCSKCLNAEKWLMSRGY